MARLSSSLPSVRILILGDSGVGKTSLLLSLTSPTTPLASSLASTSLSSVRSTIGCTPHTLLLPSVAFIELFDVGGHRKYALSRSTFYRDIDGLLLVFDCSNTKSYTHLSRWIAELVQHNESGGSGGTVDSRHQHDHDDADGQAGSRDLSSLPVLAVGTKSDLMDGKVGLFDSMRDYGLDMLMLSAKASGGGGGGDGGTLHALLPFFHRVLDRKAEQTAIGFRGGNSSNGRTQHKLSSTATAVYQRKSGGRTGGYGNGNGLGEYGDERAWDRDNDDQYVQEEQREEEDDGGLTIDMNQLDMLSAYNSGHAAATTYTSAAARYPSSSSSTSSSLFASSSSPSATSRSLSSPPAARQSSSPLSRLLPSGLFGLGGKKEDKQGRARV